MLFCNTSAITDWSYFLSRILPLVNRSTGLVGLARAETVTAAVVTSLQPDGAVGSVGSVGAGVRASDAPLGPDGHTAGTERAPQYAYSEGELLHADHRTPARGALPLPTALLYLLMAALVVVAVAYAIVGHLVKDVVNDFVCT